MAQLLNGRIISQQIKDTVKAEIAAAGATPGIAVIMVGADPASKTYVENKKKACKEVGIESKLLSFPDTIDEQTMLTTIDALNADPTMNGILIQLPLGGALHTREKQILERITPDKDVDGLHPLNIGRFIDNKYLKDTTVFLPCTPYGVIRLLESYNIPIAGKHVVVIGRSSLAGKPIGLLLLAANATVTFCHSQTTNLKEITKGADILVCAVGKPKMIDASYIKQGAVVVDVGFNFSAQGLVGDVDFASVESVASAITPVPGGVGQMTVAILMENVWKAYRQQKQL